MSGDKDRFGNYAEQQATGCGAGDGADRENGDEAGGLAQHDATAVTAVTGERDDRRGQRYGQREAPCDLDVGCQTAADRRDQQFSTSVPASTGTCRRNHRWRARRAVDPTPVSSSTRVGGQ
ncbi:hypothetical protein ACGFIK_08875 [Micromonospora sp. NPDC048871]|uniref:hypothetical protein n=1 Tax=Micromonospora sp. NPDC048871 TaxID=3364259 RepID=UPI00371F226B